MPSPNFSLAADRNKQPILDVMLKVLPAKSKALEIASGTGQQLAEFVQTLVEFHPHHAIKSG